MWDEKSDIRINALVEFLLVERIRFTQNNKTYSVLLKFVFSKKATKIEEIFTFD